MYTYLLVDLLSVLVPFLFTFHPKTKFYRQWYAFFPACLATALLFICWDCIFTKLGVWGFRPDYVTGIYLGNLPVEEILFFICIPYACVFSYYVLPDLAVFSRKPGNIPVFGGGAVLIITGLIFYNRYYTSVTFIGLGTLLIVLQLLKAKFLMRFFICYLIMLIPFFIVNGILTGSFLGRVVVWYNDKHNLGIRILTIPFEDIFYGALLVLLNISGYELLKKKLNRKSG